MSKESLSDFRRDVRNTNKGTDRGRELLEKSVEEVGWAESLVADASGNMLAGNHRHKIAEKKGVNPIIVESDGSRPVIVVRTDIKPGDPKGTKLAILSNRTADVNHQFDIQEMVTQLQEMEIEPEEVGFNPEEITLEQTPIDGGSPGDQGNGGGAGDGGGNINSGSIKSYQIVVECADESDQEMMYEKLTKEGRTCRVLTL